MSKLRKCSFCGDPDATYFDGFYVCNSHECSLEVDEACREREAYAREAAEADHYERYQ